jgi:hypothetical protein
MVNNNKILTVSYGTFSCTLEGFDDSFDTMKAIAEYFRDLAADDRYFGAEPPQPDADMLARIAQREITRRVEAHSENGGIVLRAQEDQEVADTRTPAKTAAIAAPVAAATAEQAVAEVAKAPEQEAAPAETAAVEDVSEPVIEEVEEAAEIETVEEVEEPAAVEEDAIEDDAAIEEDEVAAEAAEEVEEAEEDVAEETVEGSDDVDDEDDSAFSAEDYAAVSESLESMEDDTAEDAAEDIAPEVVETPAPVAQTSSIADKLRRIRAVVSRSEKAKPDETYLEDEHAEEVSEDDSVTESVIASVNAPEDVVVAQDDMSDEDDDAADSTETHSNLFAEDDEDQDDEAGSVMETEAYDDDEDEDESPLRARVLKVNRADLEAAIAEGELEEIDEDDVADASDDQETTLSDEEEAELQRELAEVEASVEEEDTDEDTAELDEDEDEDQGVHGHAGAKVLSENTDADEDLSRLMAETEQQMGEPEGSQRRDAFAHLRAAVAATKAEETLGTGDKGKDSADAYRDDLASVVKPRRPEASGSRTERPSTDARPAPLKLVAEQRIDVEDAEARGPVRPRRIATNVLQSGSVTVEEETDDFVEFAQNVGATKLPEVIEAAAAFIAYVEGREQFSRPQLMGKVRQVEKDGYSREDGLRAFGLLLRSGKIEKIKGGRFIVSDKIGFKPEADRARDVG